MNLSQINWKTTGYAISYIACYILGKFVPAAETLCEVVGTLIITAGFVSAADADRVKSIVRAVDMISWKNGIDPATLIPTDPAPPAPTAPVVVS
jgi:hypothetical protein